MWSWVAVTVLSLTPFAPAPQSMEVGSDSVFTVTANMPVIIANSTPSSQIRTIEKTFNGLGMSLPIVRASGYEIGEKAIHISVVGQFSERSQRSMKSRIDAMDPTPAGGYRLVVDRTGIMLVGADQIGLRHGLITLSNLLLQSRELPVVRIRDYPDTPIRGVFLTGQEDDVNLRRYTATKLNTAFFDADSSERKVDMQDLRDAGLEPVPIFDMDSEVTEKIATYLAGTLTAVGLRPVSERYDYFGKDNAAQFTKDVLRSVEAIRQVNPKAKIFLWADLLVPFREGAVRNTIAALNTISDDITLVTPVTRQDVDPMLRWLGKVGHEAVLLIDDDSDNARLTAYTALNEDDFLSGIIVTSGSPDALALAAEKSWSRSSPRLPWPEALNAFFGSDLWNPTEDEVLKALIIRLNRQTLAGVSPEEELKTWKVFVKKYRKSGAAYRIKEIDRRYENFTEFVSLEAAFTRKQSYEILEQLMELVDEHARLDSNWDRQRAAFIMDVIQKKRLFVPSTILFGHYIAPYRSVEYPEGTVLLELPAEPILESETHTIKGWYDLQTNMASIARLDFETVGTATFLLEQSDDDQRYKTVLHATSQVRGGLRPPVLLDAPLSAPYFTFVLNAPAEQAQFRNPKLYALKHSSPDAIAKPMDGEITIDGRFDEPEWAVLPQVFGFVDEDGSAFAHAGTTVRILRNDQGIYFGAELGDGPAKTVVVTAGNTQADEESLKIRIQHRPEELFEFEIDRSGATLDNLKQGSWEAAVRETPRGWMAEIHIPYTTLTSEPRISLNWGLNLFRIGSRHEDLSQWSFTEDLGADPFPMGRLAL